MPDFSLAWVIKFTCMSVMAFLVNYTQAEQFSQDDWIRIISTIAGVASIDGGVNAAKSMFGGKKE